MAIICKLYTFAKRENSTKIPDDSAGTSVDCLLKETTGIVSPSFIFAFPNTTNVSQYNYAKIETWGRYYFVEEWTFEQGRWVASMKCDVLASFRDTILASNQYVLRSASNYDQNILDTMYPATATSTEILNNVNSVFKSSLSDGSYIIGIINDDSNKVGCVTYYSFTAAQFKAFSDALFNTTNWLGIEEEDLSSGIQKALVNPFQYIVDCKWVPFAVTGTAVASLSFGWWSVTASASRIAQSDMLKTFTFEVEVPKHFQSTIRGNYLNLEPYSRYTLFYPPFGEMPIDSTRLYTAGKLYGNIGVDLISGTGTLVLSANSVIGYHYAQVAVNIQLAQTSADVQGVLSGVSQASSSFAGLFGPSSSPVSGVFGIASGILSAYAAAQPAVTTKGTNGTLSNYKYVPHLRGQFFGIVAESTGELGRPLCAEKTLSDLTGYCMVLHAEVSTTATDAEQKEIKDYLEGGFFIE